MRWTLFALSRELYYAERGGNRSHLDDYPITPSRVGPFTKIEATAVVDALNAVAPAAALERTRNVDSQRAEMLTRGSFKATR